MKIFPRSRRDLGAFLAAEIFISPRSRPSNLGGQSRPRISPLISARPKIAPRFGEISAENLGGQKRDLAEMKISAAKNAQRLLARSRRDENLGGQKRAEITGDDLAEMKISAAKNAPRFGGQKRAEITVGISAR